METNARFNRAVTAEAQRISLDQDRLRRFVDRAVDIQNKAWDADYAMRKYEFSIRVLNANNNYVTYSDKEVFKATESDFERITIANALAMSEINEGKRAKLKNAKKSTDDVVKLTLYLRRDELKRILGIISK